MVEQTEVGLFTSQDCHDILVEAIGIEEHLGRVRGLGIGFGFKAFLDHLNHLVGKPV